jgi:hypothetical protein
MFRMSYDIYSTPSSGLLIILFQFVAFEANGRVAARPHI